MRPVEAACLGSRTRRQSPDGRQAPHSRTPPPRDGETEPKGLEGTEEKWCVLGDLERPPLKSELPPKEPGTPTLGRRSGQADVKSFVNLEPLHEDSGL